MGKNRRKIFLIANRMHKKLMFIVFVAAIVPTLIMGFALYSLIFNITAWQIGFPEAVISILLPAVQRVNLILLCTLPITLLLILSWAMIISHNILGPFERLSSDIEKRVTGEKSGHIGIRTKDAMFDFVEKINRLIDKIK